MENEINRMAEVIDLMPLSEVTPELLEQFVYDNQCFYHQYGLEDKDVDVPELRIRYGINDSDNTITFGTIEFEKYENGSELSIDGGGNLIFRELRVLAGGDNGELLYKELENELDRGFNINLVELSLTKQEKDLQSVVDGLVTLYETEKIDDEKNGNIMPTMADYASNFTYVGNDDFSNIGEHIRSSILSGETGHLHRWLNESKEHYPYLDKTKIEDLHKNLIKCEETYSILKQHAPEKDSETVKLREELKTALKRAETAENKCVEQGKTITHLRGAITHLRGVIDKTNAILNANPKLLNDFKAAKAEFTKSQTQKPEEQKPPKHSKR